MKHLPHQHLYVVQASTPLPLTTCKRLSSLCVNMHMHVLLRGYHEWLFLLWSSVQWSRDRGFLVILRVSSNLYVHGSMGRVNGCVGLAIKSPKCVMRNVDAHTERKRERGRARERPSYLLHSLTDVCLLISLPCINTPVNAQPGGKLISYYLIILLGFTWSVC